MDASDDLPTLLILGAGEPMRPGLEEALARHATFAEAASTESAVAAVTAAAPDLVVLVGDAAARAESVLASLGANAMARSVPVVVVLEAGDLAARLHAARSGVVVVERTASVDAMARHIAELAREMPERPSQSGGELGEATLTDVLDIVRRELESGILSVEQEGGANARFVLRSGRRVDAAIRDFVGRIRPLIEAARPIRFDYDEDRGLDMLDASTEEGDRHIFEGRRVALIEDDAALADALAQELRAHGAQVVVLTSSGSGIDRARQLDPELLLIEESGLDGPSYSILKEVRRDPRLRWASLLVIRGEELMPPGEAPRMDRLAGAFAPLIAPDREIREKAASEERFDARLEALGPSRLLRALAASERTFHVTVRHPRVIIEIALSQGLVAGAEAVRMGDDSARFGGPTALAALLAIGSGRVTIEHRDAPASANILLPAADALAAAGHESPPIRPSVLPSTPSARPSAPPAVLLAELESVLGKLRTSGIWKAPTEVDFEERPTKRRDDPQMNQTLLGMAAPLPSDAPVRPASIPAPEPSTAPSRRPPPPPPPLMSGALRRARSDAPSSAARRRPPHKTLLGPVAAFDRGSSAPKLEEPEAIEVELPATSPLGGLPDTIETERPATSGPTVSARSEFEEASRNRDLAAPAEPPPVAFESRGDARPLDVPVHVPVLTPGAVEVQGTVALEPAEVRAPRRIGPVVAAAAIVLLVALGAAAWFLTPAETATVDSPPASEEEMAAIPAGPGTAAEDERVPGTSGDEGESADEAAVNEAAGDEDAVGEAAGDEDAVDGDAVGEDAVDEDAVGEDAVDGDPVDGDPVDGDPVDEDAVDEDADSAEPAHAETDVDDEGVPRSGPERLAFLLSSGNFFRGRGQLPIARRRYEAALRMAPRSGRALAGMTRVAIAERKGTEAVGYARRLVGVNSNNAANQVLLGDALSAAGQRIEARRAWEAALRINPRHRAARQRLGR